MIPLPSLYSMIILAFWGIWAQFLLWRLIRLFSMRRGGQTTFRSARDVVMALGRVLLVDAWEIEPH